MAFTSSIIYKYTKVESLYSKETCQQSGNVPEGAQDDDTSTAEEIKSNGQKLTHTCTYLWRGSQGESVVKGSQ